MLHDYMVCYHVVHAHKAHLAQTQEGFFGFFGILIGKMFSCACLPILFRGMAPKNYKITVSQGDICKHA